MNFTEAKRELTKDILFSKSSSIRVLNHRIRKHRDIKRDKIEQTLSSYGFKKVALEIFEKDGKEYDLIEATRIMLDNLPLNKSYVKTRLKNGVLTVDMVIKLILKQGFSMKYESEWVKL